MTDEVEVARIAKKLNEIFDGDLWQLTKELPDQLVNDGDACISIYTSYIGKRKDGTRELNIIFGWRSNGEDQTESVPSDDQRVILAHRLVAGAYMLLAKKGWPTALVERDH